MRHDAEQNSDRARRKSANEIVTFSNMRLSHRGCITDEDGVKRR